LPFDDELTFKFYRTIPDFSRFKEKENSEEALTVDFDQVLLGLKKCQSRDLIDEMAEYFMKR